MKKIKKMFAVATLVLLFTATSITPGSSYCEFDVALSDAFGCVNIGQSNEVCVLFGGGPVCSGNGGL